MSNTSRRDFLKFGAALPLALHSLDLRKAIPRRATPPRRVMFICNSLGFYRPNFFPGVRGDLSSSKYLAEIKTRDKLTVFQNLFHPGMETSNHDSEKSFLTGVPKPESPNFINSISVDQVLAKQIGTETRFPFLPLSIYDRGWGCSWNNRGVAIPPMHDEAKVFDKLFGKEDLLAKRQQIANDQLVVDCLYRDIKTLEKSDSDAAKIDSYRVVITELEKQIEHDAFWLNAQKPDVPNTLSTDVEFAFSNKIKNMLELSKLAFQTDSTRVITFSMDWIYGAIKVPGATGGWHTLSHHGGKKDVLEKLFRIESDIIRHVNQFLADLDGIKEGDGTLLDYTTVVLGSNFGDASNHTCSNLPTIVAGGGFHHKPHSVLERPTPLCNLWLEILNEHNVDVGRFGSGDQNLKLLAS